NQKAIYDSQASKRRTVMLRRRLSLRFFFAVGFLRAEFISLLESAAFAFFSALLHFCTSHHPCFQSFAHSLQKTPGCTPLCNSPPASSRLCRRYTILES